MTVRPRLSSEIAPDARVVVAGVSALGASTDRPDSISAVDWESSVLDGWPGLDLAYLLVQLAIETTRARTPEARLAAARRVWDPADELGAVAAAETKRHAAALGIDAAASSGSARWPGRSTPASNIGAPWPTTARTPGRGPRRGSLRAVVGRGHVRHGRIG